MRRHCARRASAKVRIVIPQLDLLEVRQLLSLSTETVAPLFQLSSLVSNISPPSGAYSPTQISQAYGFNKILFGSVKGDGTGQTIAIVDSYDDPNIQADLNIFDTQYGISPTTITKVNENGGPSPSVTDPSGGWELETSLDVEWAHAMAPGAKILLVEASSANDNDLLAAVSYASAHASVVSMSWGGGEFGGETSYDSYFSKSGVVFVASSGDSGAPVEWPAASANVLAVGGTSLSLTSNGTYVSESGWSGSGGGPSAYESQPSYQKGVITQTSTQRANPDVSYDASPSTGYAVYDSYKYSGTSYGWIQVGGTSAGSPQWAAIVAIADEGRALSNQALIDSSSPQEIQTILYKSESAFHDITTGTSTGSPHYSAGPGYDYVTGLGSPYANLVVGALDGTAISNSTDTLAISVLATATAGNTFSVTVTADSSGGTVDPAYLGTVQLSSTDAQASLPSSYTFTAADDGTHTFTVALKTAGSQSITATDTAYLATPVTSSSINVSPAAASKFILSGLSSSAIAGSSQSVTVTADDPYGNIATGYTGTIQLTSSDAQATFVPSSYTFSTTDHGVHSFSVTFQTAGLQSITATESSSSLSATQSGISVSPAAPTGLAAVVSSNTQINLSWVGSSGATGYIVQRSTNGSTWSQIGTTAAGTTTYSDTGLTVGTTYFYRIQATGGNGSAFSTTASATTTGGTISTTTDSLWSNSYTPFENTYSYGAYEVGIKFSSTVAGSVTGVRFYKESWMGGYTHVGHLWSSGGTLLATATFGNETSSGWQQVSFATPVAISANTTYIISFSTGGGYFGITSNSLRYAGSNGPLQIPANAGVYGNSGAFPGIASNGMNFWADVAFSPSTTAQTVPKTSTSTSSSGIAVLNSGSSTASSIGTQTTAPRISVVTSGSYPYRRTVNQSPAFSDFLSKRI